MNYYNEYDAKAATWLRSLISAGLIPNGHVDDRSITDVRPEDLQGYTQCHFFAGIGGWSRALFLAGIPETIPVWTGSCPCQPFSVAGKRKGTEDERHLWPVFRDLIAECKPPAVFGEQVASADGRNWLSVVRSEMEALGYAVGAADLCAAGVGSPHIRQRLYFVGVADAGSNGWEQGGGRAALLALPKKQGSPQGEGCHQALPLERSSRLCGMAHPDNEGSQRWIGMPECADQCTTRQGGMAGGMADARCSSVQCCGGPSEAPRATGENEGEAQQRKRGGASDWPGLPPCPADQTDGFWEDADWLWCRDGKWRPVESGSSPLANGVSGRVALLRGYGNAIVPQVAAEFIKAALLSRLDL